RRFSSLLESAALERGADSRPVRTSRGCRRNVTFLLQLACPHASCRVDSPRDLTPAAGSRADATAELRDDRAAHAQRGLLSLGGGVLPEPVQVVLRVRNLERQQKERDEIEQEARDSADSVGRKCGPLPPPDSVVTA